MFRVNHLTTKQRFLRPPPPYNALKRTTTTLVGLVFLAGLLDYVENIFMSLYLEGVGIHPILFSLAATVKALILIAVNAYLLFNLVRRIFIFLSYNATQAGNILFNYRIIVIGLVILYITLWLADQGQDLLLNLNTKWYGPFNLSNTA